MELVVVWDSVKVRHETYEKIIELKARGESKTKRPYSIASIVADAVEEMLKHDDEGNIVWGRKANAP